MVEDIDIWIVEKFAQDVLKVDPAELHEELVANHPVRHAGDEIVPGEVQWVAGDNEALRYRGNALKRAKIWLQLPPEANRDHTRRYGYTGWQWKVLPATADVDKCREVAPLVGRYNAWAVAGGWAKANHFIVTHYESGSHGIGMHSCAAAGAEHPVRMNSSRRADQRAPAALSRDKPKDIRPGSLITVVKTGAHGRPFELCYPGKEKEPFFSRVLAPGTAVIMTLEANLLTKHGVPGVDEAGPSGSIVFRTIETTIAPEVSAKKRRASAASTDRRLRARAE